MFIQKLRLLAVTAWIVFLFASVQAQSMEFVYQGRLNDGGTPANSNYDLEFRLFDVQSGSTALATQQRLNVAVSAGVFTVTLDFGASFPGAARFLEIGVRPTGGSTFTTLNPRQPITSTPYAIRSLNAGTADIAINATQLGGVAAGQYVLTGDSRLTDARPPTAGSSNYIQNTTTQQAASNFNISGNGIVDGSVGIGTSAPTAKLHVKGGEVLFDNKWRTESTIYTPNLIGGFLGTGNGGATPGNRVTAGVVGATIGGGGFNGTITFPSGFSTSNDSSNRVTDWFGTVGGGFRNRAGDDDNNLDSADLATVGGGFRNTASGESSTVSGGANNVASGITATVPGGVSNLAGGDYSFAAGFAAQALHKGTFVWADSTPQFFPSTGNNQFLIRATGGVGIGTNSPVGRLNIVGSAGSGQGIQIDNGEIKFRGDGIAHFSVFANRIPGAFTIEDTSSNFNVGTAGNVLLTIIRNNGNVGINKSNPNFTLDINGTLSVGILGTGGSEHICRISFNQLALCSSSLRYKTNIARFLNGLTLIRALQPVTFDWKTDNKHDLGLVAEDVEKVSPLLVTYNNGQVEGVKYDRISVVLINAVKEQQAQINQQQEQLKQERELIEQQAVLINNLRRLVCRRNARAAICRR